MNSTVPPRRSGERSNPVGEEAVSVDMVDKAYGQLGLNGLFEAYAKHIDDPDIDEKIHEAFIGLAVEVASLAYQNGKVDVEFVRRAFDRTYEGMNLAARQANLEKPRTVIQSLLVKAGVRKPEYWAVEPLDDEYWSEHFMKQFEDETMAERRPGEPEELDLAVYISECLEDFPWADFAGAV